MIRMLKLNGTVLAFFVGAAAAAGAQASETDETTSLHPEMMKIVEFVEQALVDPISDLEARARTGYARDKLIYGLALKAGRLGAGQDKNAKKWIKRAANSFEPPSPSEPSSRFSGPASMPARGLELKSYSGGKAIPSAPIGGSSFGNYFNSSFPVSLSSDTILIASACVDALLLSPDPTANISACGGKAQYQRLLELMPE